MGIEELARTLTNHVPLGANATALHAPPDFLEKLPLAIYACDAEGRILWFNSRAARLWGRKPLLGDDGERFCGSYRLYFGGREVSHNESPMALALKMRKAVHGVEARVERPDGSSIWAMVHIEPVEDETGTLIGAINCFHETAALGHSPDLSALRRSDRLEMSYEQAGIGMAEADAEGRLLRANAQLAAFMGYAPQELLGRSIFDATHPDDIAADRAQFRRQIAGEIDRYTVEKRIRRRNEGYFWASVTSTSVQDGYGQFLYAVRIQQDITERKAAERAMLQLASIVESSHDAIISKGLDGIITSWNQGAERIFGYTAEEAIGRPITLLIPHNRLDEEPQIIDRIRRGERVDHYETVRQRKDGSYVDISLTVSPMRDRSGRIVGASKIARDITERKLADARLRESEQRLKDLLAAIPAAIYTTDAEGKITYFNQAAVELAGRVPTIGSDEWCVTWKLFRPDGTPLPHDECPMAIALREGRVIRDAEAVAERPDGTFVPFIPYPTPLRDAAGNIVGAINMLVDISERKQAETQQRVLLSELNHRVKNNMQMLQSLLHQAARQTPNPEARRVLADASGRIAAMAAAQRVLYGTTEPTYFSAQEFVAAVCQSVQQTFSANATILYTAAQSELRNDVAMPLALILNELLTNAIKYGAPSNGSIIRVQLGKEGDSFVLCVEDEGEGFDLDTVKSRLSGLRLVQGLARQLHGRFEVTRTPASRCSVRFSLDADSGP